MTMPSRQRRLSRDGGRWLACLASGLLLFIGQIHAHASTPLAGLEDALPQYRQQSVDPALQAAWRTPLPSIGRKLEPGKPYTGLTLLVRRLVLLGDLPPDIPVPERYEGAVIEGVTAFQRRHGLEPDGILGKETFAQLEVSPAARVRQIELNIERLKQLPFASRFLLVNIPEFVLHAYDQGKESFHMKIIVGQALKTRTPIFTEEMRFIEFSPFWNVPPSIARQETIPKLRKDPDYFDDQGFEFYSGQNGIDTALNDENLEAVLQGKLRIRQRPGPKNALGGIKFVFPNNDNIYMHHTPATRLFMKARRDFSHGCIRVEAPLTLALFVLQDESEWDAQRIDAAMTKGASATLRLKTPLPVVIAYLTALPGDDGRIRFFPDLYGLDKLE